MKKNDYVQFVGILPKELQGTKGPIFGKVEKLIGKTKLVIKPRYRHFEVTVNIADVTNVTKKQYQGKAAKTSLKKIHPKPKKEIVKKIPPACVTKKDTKKNSGVTKVVKKAREELPAIVPAEKKGPGLQAKPPFFKETLTEARPVMVKTPFIKVARPTIEKKADTPTSKEEPITDASMEQKYEAGCDPHKALEDDGKLPKGLIILLLVVLATIVCFIYF